MVKGFTPSLPPSFLPPSHLSTFVSYKHPSTPSPPPTCCKSNLNLPASSILSTMAAAAALERAPVNSSATTPFSSPPSSPRELYRSAPTSPSRAYSVPFCWEESPGTPKRHLHPDDAIDFEFASGPIATATADELFDRGVIRPLKPPPRLVTAASPPPSSQRASPKSRAKHDDFDPFEKAIEETTRGRTPTPGPAFGGSHGRSARSLSPLRGAFGFHGWSGSANAAAAAAAGGGSSWKWKLKELFLFRSKSEGRVTGNQGRDVLRRYTVGPRVAAGAAVDVRNSSFRSSESSGSMRRVTVRDPAGSVGGSSRRGVSAHELHYTARRAVAEEQRKKTFLPYRQGLLSCLGFTPQMPIHDLAKSFGSFAGNRA